MDRIKFKKYSSCGNVFLLIDEILNPFYDDNQRSRFSRWAIDRDFGVGGADNVLFINAAKNTDCVYSFRIFEYDGSETILCGNGLLSVADMLHRNTGQTAFSIITGVPGCKKSIKVGLNGKYAWVNLGFPSLAPRELYSGSSAMKSSEVTTIVPLSVHLPQEQKWSKGLPKQFDLLGHFVFNGEPHLVFILGQGLPEEFEDKIWFSLSDALRNKLSKEWKDQSLALIDHMGRFVNLTYKKLFPQGVHLNFVRVKPNQSSIEYRTYERAINCETLACGSGAVAVASVCWTTNQVTANQLIIQPHRCNWIRPEAKLEVSRSSTGFILHGKPELIYEGVIFGFVG